MIWMIIILKVKRIIVLSSIVRIVLPVISIGELNNSIDREEFNILLKNIDVVIISSSTDTIRDPKH